MSAIEQYFENQCLELSEQRERISSIITTAHPVMLQLVEAILAEERTLLDACDGYIKFKARFLVILNEVQDMRIKIKRVSE